jgi:15-cis-phytoene synthase
MGLQVQQSWEYRLLSWAEEALNNHLPSPAIETSRDALQMAYAHCEQVTREHSRTFHLASGLLPEPKRRAARALYAFCRVTDDIVDCADPQTDRAAALADWRERVSMPVPPEDDLVALAWADARATFKIPRGYGEQLIKGVGSDINKTRYETFSELAEYSYGVASTVGLMAMHIIGFSSEEALPYAVKLGVALQITNILRDVAEDWRAGRVYLPQDELAAFGLSEACIAEGLIDERWQNFMRFQIARNRQLYAESLEGIAMLDRNGRLAIAAAAILYCDILQDVENHDYDVFSRRSHLTTWNKLKRMPRIWWHTRRNQLGKGV